MTADVRQIRVGTLRVGMVGLDAVFAEIARLNLRDEELEDRLVALARKSNHIPETAEHEYARALVLEYRRFRGEDVQDAGGLMEIRVLGPGCYQCDELMRRLRTVLAEMDVPADLEHIRDLGEIAAYGPMPTPGLIVNGKRTLTGRVPSPKELKAIIEKNVSAQSS
ncbi:MAG TPA: thioredoxin family protein [Acidobacteriota bacterium]|nr:thioredoxin family protein [Acidobacteriota bacterium]